MESTRNLNVGGEAHQSADHASFGFGTLCKDFLIILLPNSDTNVYVYMRAYIVISLR